MGGVRDVWLLRRGSFTGFAPLALLFTGRGVFYSEHVHHIYNQLILKGFGGNFIIHLLFIYHSG